MPTEKNLERLFGALAAASSGGVAVEPGSLDHAALALGGALVRHLLAECRQPLTLPVRRALSAVPARFVIFEEFLAPADLASLLRYAEQREPHFTTSRVISATTDAGVIDYAHRRSRLNFEIGAHRAVMADRLLSCLPLVRDKLAVPAFEIARIEVQMTASNDGDYFKIHNDNTHPVLVGREITFVYFFHREPQAFTGGGLRLYDSRWNGTRYEAADHYRTILPAQNQIVFFPSYFMHEILPVRCPSRAFMDGRFTLNGWIHKVRQR
jgi:SM-20-related protein